MTKLAYSFQLAQDENYVGHLVEMDDSLQNERTIYIMPPEPPPNATTVYCYDVSIELQNFP